MGHLTRCRVSGGGACGARARSGAVVGFSELGWGWRLRSVSAVGRVPRAGAGPDLFGPQPVIPRDPLGSCLLLRGSIQKSGCVPELGPCAAGGDCAACDSPWSGVSPWARSLQGGEQRPGLRPHESEEGRSRGCGCAALPTLGVLSPRRRFSPQLRSPLGLLGLPSSDPPVCCKPAEAGPAGPGGQQGMGRYGAVAQSLALGAKPSVAAHPCPTHRCRSARGELPSLVPFPPAPAPPPQMLFTAPWLGSTCWHPRWSPCCPSPLLPQCRRRYGTGRVHVYSMEPLSFMACMGGTEWAHPLQGEASSYFLTSMFPLMVVLSEVLSLSDAGHVPMPTTCSSKY